MKTEIDIIRDIAGRFDRLGLSYMLTGSIAMNYYAEPRMTRDIDIVLHMRETDVDLLVQELSKDYYIDSDAVREALKRASMFNLLHLESVIKVDCIIRKSSRYRNLEFERRRKIMIEDFNTFIVSKEDLILSKLCWAKDSHSGMQINDVKNLMRTGYDMPYVETWAEHLGVATLYEECRYG